jgi:hypothetical protein
MCRDRLYCGLKWTVAARSAPPTENNSQVVGKGKKMGGYGSAQPRPPGIGWHGLLAGGGNKKAPVVRGLMRYNEVMNYFMMTNSTRRLTLHAGSS